MVDFNGFNLVRLSVFSYLKPKLANANQSTAISSANGHANAAANANAIAAAAGASELSTWSNVASECIAGHRHDWYPHGWSSHYITNTPGHGECVASTGHEHGPFTKQHRTEHEHADRNESDGCQSFRIYSAAGNSAICVSIFLIDLLLRNSKLKNLTQKLCGFQSN